MERRNESERIENPRELAFLSLLQQLDDVGMVEVEEMLDILAAQQRVKDAMELLKEAIGVLDDALSVWERRAKNYAPKADK